jgi:hypothetical protein
MVNMKFCKESRIWCVVTLTVVVTLAGCKSTDSPDNSSDVSASLSSNVASFTDRKPYRDSAVYLDKGQVDQRLDGLSYLRPVLNGVLYRSGIDGDKQNGMSSSELKSLCEQGFTEVRLIDFKVGSNHGKEHSCSAGKSVNYQLGKAASSSDGEIFKTLHDIITNNKGPMLVHCLYGVHASPIIAAKALVQFCDWSAEEAEKYWTFTKGPATCGGGCGPWFAGKFRGFKKNSALSIDKATQEKICPPNSIKR